MLNNRIVELITKILTPKNSPTNEAQIAEKNICKNPTKPDPLPDLSGFKEIAAGIPSGKIKPLDIANNDIGIINWRALLMLKKNVIIAINNAPKRKNMQPTLKANSIPYFNFIFLLSKLPI
jgi:hypothetical protein